jgi:predicted DsbA family dithiol-disulfide isomerase
MTNKNLFESLQEQTAMSKLSAPIVIDYYSDVLCVWAWIAQPRLEELQRQWGSDIIIRHRYVDIFGDSHSKIQKQWGTEDGFEKFGAHVAKSAASFDQVSIHPDIWARLRPRSSMQAHLLLKAVEQVAGSEQVDEIARRIRRAFFSQALDVSDLPLLLQLLQDLDLQALQTALHDGSAMAALSHDQRSANELGVKGSPTWVLNDGRQVLYGNVGYRILNANIEELAKNPEAEASWC